MSKNDQSKFMDQTLTSHKAAEEEEPVTPPAGASAAEIEEPELKGDEGEGTTPPAEGGIEEPEKDPQAELLDWLGERAAAQGANDNGGGEGKGEEPVTPPANKGGEEEEEAINFSLDNDAFEEVTSSPEALSQYAEKIYKKAVADLRGEIESTKAELKQELATAKEELVQNIPNLVAKSTERTQAVKGLVSNFYTKYPELKEKREYVRDMIRTVSGKNPEMSPEAVLTEVATRAKRDFGIAEKAQTREQQRNNSPKFAGAGGRRAPSGHTDTRTKQQKLLEDTFG